MEVGRRNLGSENEFRERRRSSGRRKKREALPLAMILSFNDRDVHPDCPNVSNPYHKCGRHCLDRIPSAKNFLEAIRSDGDRELEKIADEKGVHPNCPHASNPYHKCAEYCWEKLSPKKRQEAGINIPGMNRKEEKKAIFTTEAGVKPVCIYASNPYHVCAEYCSQTVLEEDQPGQSMRLKGFKQGEKVLSTKVKTGFHPQCKHAPNPNRECTESCFQSVTDRNVAEGEKPKRVSNKVNKSSVHLNRTASSHNKVEYCFEDTPKKEQLKRDMKLNKKNEIDVTTQRGFTCECKNASSPYHVCVDTCFQSFPEREQHGQVIRLKSSKEGEKVMSNIESTAIKKLKEEEMVVLPSERGVCPECKFASNPYHACAKYCFQNALKREHHGQVTKLKSLKDLKNLVSNKKITSGHPQCEYASNPYHKCAEYCFNKNIPISKIPGGVLKINESKKEKSHALGRDDNPKYKDVSNSFHRCDEYFPEEISPKSEAVEGSTATVKEKRRNSSKENKRDLVEKISLNSNYMEASKPRHNYIESSEGIILQDGTEKSSMDSNYVEAFNPTNNNFNFNNGISMNLQDVSKDLQSAKMVDIIRSRRVPTDMPPLHIDASDLFQEWAQYCSQTKDAEGEIVEQEKKVGMGEFTTKNGKGNCFLKDYDSANMEKVQAKVGFPRSLPVSLLFLLLGFLLSLLHWTQMIHSLVMSSEKNEETERMKHESYLQHPKCKKVSDPYHKCSQYCFSVIGEERH